MWFLICREKESVRAEREVTLSMLLWSIGIWGFAILNDQLYSRKDNRLRL